MKTRAAILVLVFPWLWLWVPGARAETSVVARVEVVPKKLSVTVHAHRLPPSVDCWTYVSDGLSRLGQKELVFTVKRREGEAAAAFPRELLQFYGEVFRLAQEHHVVVEGDVTALAPTGPSLLSGTDFRGILYTPAQPLADLSIPAPHLTAILVTADEIKAVAAFGATRLLSRLGQHYRYYPVPPFAERGRSSLMTAAEPSLLAKTMGLSAPRASVWQAGEARVILQLRGEQAAVFQRQLAKLSPETALTVLVGVDAGADAALVWTPGQDHAAMISAAQKPVHLAGSFVVFVPQQEEDGVQRFEDGFALFLRDATWKAVRQALRDGKPLSLPPSGDKMAFELAWEPRR